MKWFKSRFQIDPFFTVLIIFAALCLIIGYERHIQGVELENSGIWSWVKAISGFIAAAIASLATGPLAIIGAIFGGVAAITELWQAISAPKGYKDLYQARDFYFTLTLIFTVWAFARAWILKRRERLA
jgi:hypothetical protein